LTAAGNPVEGQKKFYAKLAAELIDNVYDGVARRDPRRGGTNNEERTVTMLRNPRTGEIRRGLDLHLTPTKRKRKVGEVETNHTYQGHCCATGCKKKSQLICSGCDENSAIPKQIFICDPRKKPECWETHVATCHQY
jgi:hypothetical protein